MFDHLFKSPSTIALHATAPYAEERFRYLNYCRQRGDTHLTVLRKAWDLVWVARKLPSLQVTIGQIQALMFDCSARDELCPCNLDSRWPSCSATFHLLAASSSETASTTSSLPKPDEPE